MSVAAIAHLRVLHDVGVAIVVVVAVAVLHVDDWSSALGLERFAVVGGRYRIGVRGRYESETV